MELKDLAGKTVRVTIIREHGLDTFQLLLENGYTEELEPDEARKWFKDHGVTDDEAMEHALDMAWNFYRHRVKIDQFKVPQVKHPAYQVQL